MTAHLAALAFGLAVAFCFGAGFAWALRATSTRIDRAVTLPAPAPWADANTTRIDPVNVVDLRRARSAHFEEYV